MLQYKGSVLKLQGHCTKGQGQCNKKVKMQQQKMVIQLLFFKQYDNIISKNKVHVY